MSQLYAVSSAEHEQKQPYGDGRTQLSDESDLWFRRYKLYAQMGFERSLFGAVQLERERLHAVHAETATDSQDQPKAHAHKRQVPGSWKDASVKFHWQERVRAYDAAVFSSVSEHQARIMANGYANKTQRILLLQEMVKQCVKQEHAAYTSYPIEDTAKAHAASVAYIREIRGLLSDLRAEMSDITDETLQLWFANAMSADERRFKAEQK